MGEMNKYTRQDCNAMIYAALKPLRTSLSGGIYIDDERPNNSTKEDIVINTPSLTIGEPGELQKGYSNVNIYVPKITTKTTQGSRYAYNKKSEALTRLVIEALQGLKTSGVISIESENEVSNTEAREHFINIRLKITLLKTE